MVRQCSRVPSVPLSTGLFSFIGLVFPPFQNGKPSQTGKATCTRKTFPAQLVRYSTLSCGRSAGLLRAYFTLRLSPIVDLRTGLAVLFPKLIGALSNLIFFSDHDLLRLKASLRGARVPRHVTWRGCRRRTWHPSRFRWRCNLHRNLRLPRLISRIMEVQLRRTR